MFQPSQRFAAEPRLRERKRIATMRHIQQTAVELFERDGFDEVTITQVADVAEVSPSTVYRYFGTKEALLLHDDQDEVFLRLLAGFLPQMGFWAAVQATIDTIDPADFEEQREIHLRRMRFFLQSPSVRSRGLVDLETIVDQLATLASSPTVAEPCTEFEARLLSGALIWGLLVVMERWYLAEVDPEAPTPDPVAMVRDAVRVLRGAG